MQTPVGQTGICVCGKTFRVTLISDGTVAPGGCISLYERLGGT
jgi:hypothetical protein